METEHRNLLDEKTGQLIMLIDLNVLMPFIMTERIFTRPMLEDIYEIKDEFNRKWEFLKELETRGPHAFNKFINALEMAGQQEALQLLIANNPRTSDASIVKANVPNNSSMLQGSDNVNINVSKNSNPTKNDMEKYKVTSNPSGYCLIINNVDFGDLEEYRVGSDLDATRLKLVFEYLGYDVQVERNLETKEMNQTLYKFSQKSEFEQVDSCIVVILSHGFTGLVYGTDLDFLCINDILDMFSNEKCTALLEKPKLFFIQACRGREFDIGVTTSVSADSLPVSVSSKSKNIASEKRVPILTDMLISYSTIEGYISIRDHVLGSWYCQALCMVFKEDARTSDLQSMLRKVDKQVKSFTTNSGEKQATEITVKGWDKLLYFNVTHDFLQNPVIL